MGQVITLNGWAQSIRDHGDLVFIDLRDRTGIVQLRADAAESGEMVHAAAAVKPEFVLSVTGEVRRRAAGMENPKLATGDVEIEITRLEVLNTCRQPLPFQLSDEAQMAQVNEELRVRYRYLDLRRPWMQRMLRLRHDVVALIREYLNARDFLEIETPIFTKSTPEGARDYLVPYRLQPGLFYALPQSPQQYKQLLMVGGCERYYQIAKCFRDEAQRADRQPEFTQLDLEMSFVSQEDVLQTAEGCLTHVIETLRSRGVTEKRLAQTPFPRLSYDEAISRFGSDKPDLRFGLELVDCGPMLQDTQFAVFRGALDAGGQVKALRYPGGGSLSRKEIDELAGLAREFRAKGMAYILLETAEEAAAKAATGAQYTEVPMASGEMLMARGPAARYLSGQELAEICSAAEAAAGDLLLFLADSPKVVAAALGRLRLEIGKRLQLADPHTLYFCWIVDFPLVEWNEEEGRWDASHHPFTMPHEEDIPRLATDPGSVRAQCYDIVCNGMEFASGSIRIHRPDIQAQVFALLGIGPEEQRRRFGHILDAFAYGAPPHGGIAPGIDRLVMRLMDTENIREVMAFPKLGAGIDPLMGAPSEVDPAQLEELGLRIVAPD